jgi:virginiamycin B lyase
MKRILHLALPAMICTSAAFSMQAQTPLTKNDGKIKATISEFATPSQASLPQGLDIACDGNVWYTETSAGKIAVLRPDHTSAEYTVPNVGQPVSVKIASDGLWFTDAANRAIGLLNPGTGKIEEYAIPSGSSPLFIQIAADGSKWFSEPTGVGRLSPRGVITEWNVTLEHPDDNIEQLSLDPWGNVWFVERNFDGAGAAGTNKVRRLNPRINVISTYLVPTLGGNPAGVLANANGTVWVSEYFANAMALLNPFLAPHSDETVSPSAFTASNQTTPAPRLNSGRIQSTNTKVSPSTHVAKASITRGWVEYPIPTADAMAEDMRTDRAGRLWFEEDSGLLGILDPFTAKFTEYTIPSVDSGYYNIAFDDKTGLLWFSEAGAFAAVTTKVGYLNTDN